MSLNNHDFKSSRDLHIGNDQGQIQTFWEMHNSGKAQQPSIFNQKTGHFNQMGIVSIPRSKYLVYTVAAVSWNQIFKNFK